MIRFPVNPRRLGLPFAIGLLLAAPLAFAQSTAPAAASSASTAAGGTWSADQVRSMQMRQGSTAIDTLQLDDGQWQAKARKANGDWEDLSLDARTGQQIDDGEASGLTADQILDKLTADGYSGFDTLEFEDGEWHTDATNAAHQHVELHIDASTGKVTSEESTD
jgi:hypothetical protein